MMNLYLIERNDDEIGYDETTGYVIAAETQDAARAVASTSRGDEGAAPWLDEKRSTVKLVGVATEQTGAGIVLQSFNAG